MQNCSKKAGLLEYIKRINIYMKQRLGHFIAGICIANHKLLPITILSYIFHPYHVACHWTNSFL